MVTPFRRQAVLIKEMIDECNGLADCLAEEHDFIVSTAHSFQGDERDCIIFSPVLSEETPLSSKRFLALNANLFNVAITRARASLIVIGDIDALANSGIDYLEHFIAYCTMLESKHRADIERQSSNSVLASAIKKTARVIAEKLQCAPVFNTSLGGEQVDILFRPQQGSALGVMILQDIPSDNIAIPMLQLKSNRLSSENCRLLILSADEIINGNIGNIISTYLQ